VYKGAKVFNLDINPRRAGGYVEDCFVCMRAFDGKILKWGFTIRTDPC
jgi:hypothetical protein